ncbi:Ldh family oxidoreductase [Falsirhodobacter algicola]|uniref:Oxidoreductase n=1 Tax=Falsirhodobacter algicola TaxID=2692330 RepID=A0A8J8MU29_9RHOB|nr:Ldh family oxidoreductase [Falsirhodobacter algicola]QUS36752.1 oxidoreductase [Falsirhodobacter algicola]
MTDTISIPDLDALVTGIFETAGLSAHQARTVAAVIVAGERDACKSHGIYRIEGCLRTVKAGKVDGRAVPQVDAGDGPVVHVDAAGAFAPAAFDLGLPALEARTRTHGVAVMAINGCTHFSALWPEVEALADRGLAALAMCPSYATVAPTGGNRALLGTNPLAFAWPRRDEPPYVFDFATSVAARGEIELHRQAGTPLPEGWAVDAEGRPTTDPAAALDGAMLPFGGHKGSAIVTMIELLAGVMIGDLTSPEALDYLGTTALSPHHGEIVIAFDPEHFARKRGHDPLQRAEILFEAILDQGARLPSQRRFAARARSLREGVSLSAAERALLARLAAQGLDAV